MHEGRDSPNVQVQYISLCNAFFYFSNTLRTIRLYLTFFSTFIYVQFVFNTYVQYMFIQALGIVICLAIFEHSEEV